MICEQDFFNEPQRHRGRKGREEKKFTTDLGLLYQHILIQNWGQSHLPRLHKFTIKINRPIFHRPGRCYGLP